MPTSSAFKTISEIATGVDNLDASIANAYEARISEAFPKSFDAARDYYTLLSGLKHYIERGRSGPPFPVLDKHSVKNLSPMLCGLILRWSYTYFRS